MRRVFSFVLLLTVLSLAAAQEPVGICGVDGFDLTTLHFGQFWNFTVENPGVNCLHDFDKDDVASCTVYFSVCKPLPLKICDVANVTYCEVVTDKSGTEHKYIIGKYTIRHSFLAHSNGFTSIRYGDRYENETECPDVKFVTTTNFECDIDAKFNMSMPDITEYVSSIGRVNDCFNIITIKYSGACYVQPTLAPTHCSLTGYNTTALSKMDYFHAEVSSGICYNFGGDPCHIFLALCHPLPLDISDNCSNPESALCQANKLVDATKGLSMGAYENYTRFYENVDTDQVGFHAFYNYGTNPGNPECTNGIATRIVFVCNKTANWDKQNVKGYIEIEKEPCFYNIIAQYSGACYKAHDINKSHRLSQTSYIGWIFIGIFLFGVLVYLVAGSTFQYFVKKERGIRVLPNFDFWRNFVLLTMEGCKFTLDTITCHRCDGTPGKGKVNYDQL